MFFWGCCSVLLCVFVYVSKVPRFWIFQCFLGFCFLRFLGFWFFDVFEVFEVLGVSGFSGCWHLLSSPWPPLWLIIFVTTFVTISVAIFWATVGNLSDCPSDQPCWPSVTIFDATGHRCDYRSDHPREHLRDHLLGPLWASVWLSLWPSLRPSFGPLRTSVWLSLRPSLFWKRSNTNKHLNE